MLIFNALQKKKVKFVPNEEGRVSMYVCGITPYDSPHLGHALTAIRFNIVRSYLEHKGYAVIFVQNYTDIDDKIINKAVLSGSTPFEIAQKYISEYEEAMKSLNVRKPDIQPRVSEYINEITLYIDELIRKGYAYQSGQDVYFDISKDLGYGKLSGKKVEELKSGTRVIVEENKRSIEDFALWKGGIAEGASWHSPWGIGRPGWHIECSVMSNKLLGNNIDIHGGGLDLMFPHHENELAQCEAHNDCQYVNYWMYSGLLNINGAKMSKSLGNFVTVKDALQKYGSDLLRFIILRFHYRSAINLCDDIFKENLNSFRHLYQTLDKVEKKYDIHATDLTQVWESVRRLEDEFIQAMDDDFNTPLALVALSKAQKHLDELIDLNQDENEIIAIYNGIKSNGCLLGLFTKGYEETVNESLNFHFITHGSPVMTLAELNDHLKQRDVAREAKDFSVSDEIRDWLFTRGIKVLDGIHGSEWQFVVSV